MTVQLDLIELTADIVAAFVSKNSVRGTELPEVIAAIHTSLADLAKPKPAEPQIHPLTPAVPIKKSVTHDYLVCLDDGRKFKSLRRHLGALGMTPDEYRAKWSLPFDYPMVAPGYAAKRSELARASGLGRKDGSIVDGGADTALPLGEEVTDGGSSVIEALTPREEQPGEQPISAPAKRRRAAAKSVAAAPEPVQRPEQTRKGRPAKKGS